MHRALDIPEILYDIFSHLAPDQDRAWTYEQLPAIRALARLARTRQAFKEPALDALWSVLPDFSALARCVPDAVRSKKHCHYEFRRPLTEAEWATIQSYARRVRIFHDYTLREACLEDESIAMLFNHTGGTLFPSLWFLSWGHGRSFPHVTAQPLKILHLDLRRGEISECRNILGSVGNICPFIERFRLSLSRQHVELDVVMSNQVLRWSNLRTLECSDVALNADAIAHISRMSTLTHLSFVVSEEALGQIPSGSILVFSNLTWCDIVSGRLLPAVNLFARTRLPVIKDFTFRFPGSPSKQTIWSLMTSLRSSCSSGTLTHLSILNQRSVLRRLSTCDDFGSNNCPITYDDLHPCTTLGSLRSLKLNFDQPVHLTDNDLVDLGSAWPHLEDLTINNDAGWRSAGGLTLHGLVRLLRTCPALRNFCILFDTPTFTRVPEGMDVSYPPRQLGYVNLVESPLEAGMFHGVAEVFVAIRFSPRSLIAWRRVETEQRRAVGVPQVILRSWRDLDDEVKARIASQ